jgi:prepilin-type N-terminal cleavage/methylation domain-containing protein
VVTLRHERNLSAAFTLVELLAVVAILAVLVVLGAPTIRNALHKRDVTRTMNNARELYLAGFHMATDGATKSDANLAWPGDYPETTLAEYCGKLVQNDYLKANELQRILSAPGATCAVTSTAGSPTTVNLAGRSALKVYKIKGADPSSAIFSASSNYIYNTPLSPTAAPFGDKGFVVVRKSGDADMYGKNQATVSGWGNAAEFQSKIGILPGTVDGQLVSGDGAMALTGPE